MSHKNRHGMRAELMTFCFTILVKLSLLNELIIAAYGSYNHGWPYPNTLKPPPTTRG